MEAVCLRMVESDVQTCAIALFKQWRSRRRRPQRHLAFLPEARSSYTPHTADKCMRAEYTVSSEHFRQNGMFLRKHLAVDAASCIPLAAKSGRLTTAEEVVDMGRGHAQRFYIEALPLRFHRHHSGVMAFFYPL